MNSTARDLGVTLLRLWIGFLIALAGYEMGQGISVPATLSDLKGASLESWTLWTLTLIFTGGGVFIFLGFAFRLAAFLIAMASIYFLWDHLRIQFWDILNFRLHTIFLVASVVLILTGPGRLSLDTLRKKNK